MNTERRFGKQRLDLLRGGIERHRCAHEFRFCPIDDGLLKTAVRNELPVGGGRHRKACRDRKSRGRQSCQRLAFAAYRIQVCCWRVIECLEGNMWVGVIVSPRVNHFACSLASDLRRLRPRIPLASLMPPQARFLRPTWRQRHRRGWRPGAGGPAGP